MRLINADALKAWIDCGHLRPPTEVCFSELDVVRMIDKQPTIDAVQVVHCKDCRHKDLITAPNGYIYCTRLDICAPDDGFCHKGEMVRGDTDG